MNTTGKIVFGEITKQEAERKAGWPKGYFSITLPPVEIPDWTLDELEEADKTRFREIALRWKKGYVGNFLRVPSAKEHGDNWLVYDAGKYSLTTDCVHVSDMAPQEDIDDFVCNAPEDVKWLLATLLDLVEKD